MRLGNKIVLAIAAVAITLGAAAGMQTPVVNAVENPPSPPSPNNPAEPEQVTAAFRADSPYALVNGERLDMGAEAKMYSDELYAPLRFMAELYGGEVTWAPLTQTANIRCRGNEISYTTGKPEMSVNGKKISVGQPRQLGGKLYVSSKSFAAAIGVNSFEDGELAAVGDGELKFEVSEVSAMLAELASLPVVGSEEKFRELMAERTSGRVYYNTGIAGGGMTESAIMNDAVAAPAAPTPMPQADGGASLRKEADYSTTNIQVEGVDEADVIKTDGEYIYYANANRIWIVKATPADDMKIVSNVDFPTDTGRSDGFYPAEMYVDGNELVVIGNAMRMYYVNKIPNYQSMTRAYVYDISDRANPKKTREVESEGNYVTSRKVGKALYMLSNSWVYGIADGVYPLPAYRDTAASNDYAEIGYDRLYYFPNFSVDNYLFITGFEVDKPKQEAKINSYLGSGNNVYVSGKNMYVAATEYARSFGVMRGSSPNTSVHKFALDAGNVRYENKQSVPGTILNQFSMDEYDGHFRIATTDYDESQQKNALYILDDRFEIVGKIEDIAPGERIYSTRFMGARAYMVTFKNVDPLFVMDLSNPTAPKILGALKIPGYSNYLHPYDENHLIGIGKDTVETKNGANYKGVKLSLFDVTDVTNPKELFVEIIGDRGTESPALHNHKALLFDKDRGLLAFPVSLAEIAQKQEDDIWQYGEFKYQGAYVYGLDLSGGFKLKGRITHMSEQDMLKAGMYGYDYEKAVERIIFIRDHLYTASQTLIKSTTLEDIQDVGSVELK